MHLAVLNSEPFEWWRLLYAINHSLLGYTWLTCDVFGFKAADSLYKQLLYGFTWRHVEIMDFQVRSKVLRDNTNK